MPEKRLSLPLFCLLVLMTCTQAFAVNPDEVLKDPGLEARARTLSAEIRCLVCQNQSIDDSDAQLAKDLRVLVREQLIEGKSDDEILTFLVERYGEFVLLKPQFSYQNMFLWITPFLALIGGIWLLRSMFTRRTATTGSEANRDLTKEEKAELSKILDK